MTVEVLFVVHASCGLGPSMPGGRVHGLDLSADGARQARRLGEHLAQRRLSCVYSSPLRPARLTAQAISKAGDAPLQIEDDLQAMDLGPRTAEPIAPFLAGDDPAFDLVVGGAPQGEGLIAVQARVARFFERVVADHGGRCVAAVTHPEVVRAAICATLGIDLSAHARLAVEPCGVSSVLAGAWGLKLSGFNLLV